MAAWWSQRLVSTVFMVWASLYAAGAALGQQGGPALLVGGTFYPRVVRVGHGAARGRLVLSTDGVIFESLDEGRSFTKIGAVAARAGSRHVCCSTLFEVPRDVGSLKAGTLLSAGTYAAGADPSLDPSPDPAIEIYASEDGGRTWRYLATPVQGGPRLPTSKPVKQRGLWEPEFEVAADGALVLFVSDETDACCSQKLIEMRTYHGVRWRDRRDVIAMPKLPGARPGMIVSTALPGGGFLMSYEICGDRFGCDVYTRTSVDGWNFGDPAATGTRVETATGQFFRHSPSNVWAAGASGVPGASGASVGGRVLLIGQMLYEADGRVSKLNGRVFLTNSDLSGGGKWTVQAAPVAVPGAYDNYCPNYSSVLLPSVDGRTVLELASDYDAGHRCVTYFGLGLLGP